MANHDPLSATYSLAALTQADVVALCRHAGCALPTPDVDLAECLRMVGHTPQSLYESLRDVTEVRLMIAAATIRGVRRLPRDPRLDPAPLPPTPRRAAADPSTPSTRAGRPAGTRASAGTAVAVASSTAVVVHLAPNPKRAGSASWERYGLYRLGATRAELIAGGVRAADLTWDLERGFLRFAEPDAGEPSE